jgi:transketolase
LKDGDKKTNEGRRMTDDIMMQCANAIRVLSMDGVQKAKSGHPGMPMGMADVSFVLWDKFLQHNPKDPTWPNRDRFVLSAGHGSMLIYSLLHLTGYDLPLDELKNFRQWGSKTPGHPEYGHTPGVEITTGPLGQGISSAVGMAFAEHYLATKFNRPDYPIVDHYTCVIASDGDLMEGVSHEACSLAGHLKLNKLIVYYDCNRISIDGSTDLSFTEDVGKRFEAYGWYVQEVDGHNMDQVEQATNNARAEKSRPNLIICNTHIGYGSPNKQDTAGAHGAPLGEDEIKLTREKLGWSDMEPFSVPDAVYTRMGQAVERGAQLQSAWEDMMKRYREAYPDLADLWDTVWEKKIPDNLNEVLHVFEADEKGVATRSASGKIINALAPSIPSLLGGSADLHASNNTLVKGEDPITAENFAGRNIYYGVREHGMGSIMNGMALHGGIIPFGGTFLVFSDYMKPSVRLAALMGLQVFYVFTHDSIGLGEDGPTHQPIEHIHALRIIPNMYTIRPADANETAMAWRIALERRNGPTALILTRQAVPTFDRSGTIGKHGPAKPVEGVLRGAYVLYTAPNPDIILMASGSEVAIAMDAARMLEEKNVAVRVVSMPCWELFNEQDVEYRNSVLPPAVDARISIEASFQTGWGRYFAGPRRRSVAINTFGASAPYQELYKQFGFTAERVVALAEEILAS